MLLSASLCDLQEMLILCFNAGMTLDIIFSNETFFLFKIGKVHGQSLLELHIVNNFIRWLNGWSTSESIWSQVYL